MLEVLQGGATQRRRHCSFGVVVGNFPYVTGVLIECCVPNDGFTMPKAAAPSRVQVDAEILQNWAILRGASARQAERIVALLSVEFMCALPLPPRTYRKPGIASHLWLRYLFRRHVQAILKWTTRREETDPTGFGSEVNSLIRERLFPEPATHRDGATAIRCEEPCDATSTGGGVGVSGFPARGSTAGDCGDGAQHGHIPAITNSRGGSASTDHSRSESATGTRTAAFGARHGDGSPLRQSRGPDITDTVSWDASLHLGAHQPSEGESVRTICPAHWPDTTIISDVAGSTEYDRESETIGGGSPRKGQPRPKRARRGAQALGGSSP